MIFFAMWGETRPGRKTDPKQQSKAEATWNLWMLKTD